MFMGVFEYCAVGIVFVNGAVHVNVGIWVVVCLDCAIDEVWILACVVTGYRWATSIPTGKLLQFGARPIGHTLLYSGEHSSRLTPHHIHHPILLRANLGAPCDLRDSPKAFSRGCCDVSRSRCRYHQRLWFRALKKLVSWSCSGSVQCRVFPSGMDCAFLTTWNAVAAAKVSMKIVDVAVDAVAVDVVAVVAAGVACARKRKKM
eukprot:CAMPEP_0198115296 /NCGR_PEP_ID=MMETSP1442-20131203/6451_1 /TAXON_ID= /ORGANISM="Craspedostauros australis, Strain CCMP3328" /LENGTH=203 /DNA_ID=CAMNT_0043772787 /DNA_START=89 /DNA_END=697 /DNA_ORIENTATION=-